MKCKICEVKLSSKTREINKIFDTREMRVIQSLRKDRAVCSECYIQMLMLDLI